MTAREYFDWIRADVLELAELRRRDRGRPDVAAIELSRWPTGRLTLSSSSRA